MPVMPLRLSDVALLAEERQAELHAESVAQLSPQRGAGPCHRWIGPAGHWVKRMLTSVRDLSVLRGV